MAGSSFCFSFGTMAKPGSAQRAHFQGCPLGLSFLFGADEEPKEETTGSWIRLLLYPDSHSPLLSTGYDTLSGSQFPDVKIKK